MWWSMVERVVKERCKKRVGVSGDGEASGSMTCVTTWHKKFNAILDPSNVDCNCGLVA